MEACLIPQDLSWAAAFAFVGVAWAFAYWFKD